MSERTSSQIEEELDINQAHLVTLEFLLTIAISQQGPENIRAFLKNIENASVKSSDDEKDALFIRSAKEHLERIRQKLYESLEIWEKPQPSHREEVVHG